MKDSHQVGKCHEDDEAGVSKKRRGLQWQARCRKLGIAPENAQGGSRAQRIIEKYRWGQSGDSVHKGTCYQDR